MMAVRVMKSSHWNYLKLFLPVNWLHSPVWIFQTYFCIGYAFCRLIRGGNIQYHESIPLSWGWKCRLSSRLKGNSLYGLWMAIKILPLCNRLKTNCSRKLSVSLDQKCTNNHLFSTESVSSLNISANSCDENFHPCEAVRKDQWLIDRTRKAARLPSEDSCITTDSEAASSLVASGLTFVAGKLQISDAADMITSKSSMMGIVNDYADRAPGMIYSLGSTLI